MPQFRIMQSFRTVSVDLASVAIPSKWLNSSNFISDYK